MKTYVFIKIFLQKYVSNAFIDKNILNGRKLNQAIPVCDFYKFHAINYRGNLDFKNLPSSNDLRLVCSL